MGANAESDQQAKRNRQASKAEKKRVKKLESELRRKDKALAETAALLTLSKKPRRSGAPKTRTIDQPPGSPQQAIALIEQAQSSGARLVKACALLNLSVRTYQRWTTEKAVKADQRPVVVKAPPTNKLTSKEREAVVALCNEKQYRSCPPCHAHLILSA